MAQLSSPGVSVTVVDESFYTPAAPGTVPLIVVASAESKQNGAATGTAFGTLKENAGKVYLLTSQKDLSDTFGIPTFYTDAGNNPIHAGEQNEYGLQAAYSYLGVSNRAYIVRADLDLGQLSGNADAPGGNPADGTYWFDTTDTKFGIFEWNAATKKYTVKRPVVITDHTQIVDNAPTGAPKISVGSVGDYAIVATDSLNKLYYKKGDTGNVAMPVGTWVEVGSTDWIASWPTATSNTANPILTTTLPTHGTFVINDEDVTIEAGANTVDVVAAINLAGATGITASLGSDGKINLYSEGADIVMTGTQVTQVGFTETTPYIAPALHISKHTQVPNFDIDKVPTGAVWVKTTKPNLGADWIIKKYNAASDAWVEQSVSLYENGAQALGGLDPISGGLNLAVGTVYVKYNKAESDSALADFTIYARKAYGPTTIKSIKVETNTFPEEVTATFTFKESTRTGSYITHSMSFDLSTGPGKATTDVQNFLDAFGALIGSNVKASKTASNEIVLSHITGGDILFIDGDFTPIETLFVGSTNFQESPSSNYDYVASLWTDSFDITASSDALVSKPADGTLWYNTIHDEIDIMIHDGGTWVGYANGVNNTDVYGPIVSATKPMSRPDGNTTFEDGDLWVSTADLENFPMVYKYSGTEAKWILVDNADQTSSDGILFADARWSVDGGVGNGATPSSIVDLLSSDFLDPDAPDPALYPRGMLLWNLRRSGFNVKKYVVGKIDTTLRNHRQSDDPMTDYYEDRWVSAAANQLDGSGSFGRKAVREVVVAALNATVNANQQIRDEESRIFNLLACPGYPELITALVGLNYDRGLTSFVVGDTPARLTPDATTLSNWGNNTAQAAINGDDGLVTTDAYLGMFYPWGYTTDLIGNNIVVPPSHMMLRTIALSDNVSYPWFAPAGTRRGGITNVSSVGYIDPKTGEFHATALNTGQRDTLASIHVNPITYITGTGLVNYGQYTRQLTASSLDRINVARLVIYLRRQFSQLAKPYVFEPNDTITRNEIKQAAESLLLELVGQRALYDYLVVCDTSNNTPARIDRSELHLDVAIEPVKAVEFIYIPLRLKNTGEIKGLGA